MAQRLSPILHKQLESSFIGRVQASVACNKSCNFTTGETGLDGNLCGAGTSHAKIEGRLCKAVEIAGVLICSCLVYLNRISLKGYVGT